MVLVIVLYIYIYVVYLTCGFSNQNCYCYFLWLVYVLHIWCWIFSLSVLCTSIGSLCISSDKWHFLPHLPVSEQGLNMLHTVFCVCSAILIFVSCTSFVIFLTSLLLYIKVAHFVFCQDLVFVFCFCGRGVVVLIIFSVLLMVFNYVSFASLVIG
jgi:hypothetical protein